MSNTITKKNLEAIVARINKMTNSPFEPYTKDETGHFRANVGCYTLDWAYGGVKLERICNESGGVNSITSGYVSKRALYDQLFTFIAGLEARNTTA